MLKLTVFSFTFFLQESREANSTHLVAKVFLFLDVETPPFFGN